MKAVIFGATGFIGSHVAEQLRIAGHEVTAMVRRSSDTSVLSSLGIRHYACDMSRENEVARALEGSDAVFNCTARPHPNLTLEEHREVEVKLASMLARATAAAQVKRFVQLSTIQVHGSRTPSTPISEATPTRADTPFQQAYIEREQAVLDVGLKTGLETVIYRPASTIGVRDQASFYSRLYHAYKAGKFPLTRHNNGATRVSLIDTRDLGRAMEWLGRYEHAAGQIYLSKGFDVCWRDVMESFARYVGPIPQKKLPPVWVLNIIANIAERLAPPPKVPALARFMVLALTHDVIIDDSKLKATGFRTLHDFHSSTSTALRDIVGREKGITADPDSSQHRRDDSLQGEAGRT